MPTPIFTALTKGELMAQLASMLGDNLALSGVTPTAVTAADFTDTVNLIDADDSRLKGAWVWFYKGTGAVTGNYRRISTFASNKITPTGGNWTTTPVTTDNYAITRMWGPNDYDQAIVQAQRLIGLLNLKEQTDRSIILGSALLNGTFYNWNVTTTPDSWTASGAGLTVAKETTIVRMGLNSMKMSGSTGTGQERQIVGAGQFQGLSVSAKGWVYTRAAAADATLRLQCRDSAGNNVGTTQTKSPGALGWAYIETPDYVVPATAADIAIDLLQTANGGEIYWSGVRLPLPGYAGMSYQLDANSNWVYLHDTLWVTDLSVAETVGNPADRYRWWIGPKSWRILREGTRRIQINANNVMDGSVLSLEGWQNQAALSTVATTWTGNAEALLWAAASILLEMRGERQAADAYAKRAADAEARFKLAFDTDLARGLRRVEAN